MCLNYYNLLNKNRIDLFRKGLSEMMCEDEKGSCAIQMNRNTNIPLYRKALINIDLKGWKYPMKINYNSTPKQVLADLWALLHLKAQPKIIPDGSRVWSGCDVYCPPDEDKPKYVIKTFDGKILDNSKTLAENNVLDSDTLMATLP